MRVLETFGLRSVGDKEVGIEIEMEAHGIGMGGENLGGVPPAWKVIGDGSLRGEACEFVLRVPVVRKDVSVVLKAVATYLKDRGITISDSDRCGVHVHVNVQPLEVTQVINFILLYLIFEDLLVKYCGEEREGNLFCLRARDAEVFLIQLKACRVDDNLGHLQSESYRYASINVSAIQKYGSLEFRALKTPKRVTDIEEWVNMLLAVKDYALTIKDSRDIVEAFSRNGEISFLNTVFGKDLAKVLMCKDAAELMREGVRRIQDIAYSKLVPKKKSDLTYTTGLGRAGLDPRFDPRWNQQPGPQGDPLNLNARNENPVPVPDNPERDRAVERMNALLRDRAAGLPRGEQVEVVRPPPRRRRPPRPVLAVEDEDVFVNPVPGEPDWDE